MTTTKAAIIGSGNIGTDLLIKVLRLSEVLDVALFVGIDPDSDGLARARRLGVETTHEGVEGLLAYPSLDRIEVVFDATSARVHRAHHEALAPLGKRLVDLTPAAIGPYVVPAVNLTEHLDAPNVNMVTCGGQATIPVVAAVSSVVPVEYAEIVASIASRSAGPGTRANIDEFTETTRLAIERVGGARRGKAIIVLNPAEPPLIMRDTVLCLTDRLDPATRERVARAVRQRVDAVADYVPGYRLKHQVQFLDLPPQVPTHTLGNGRGASAPEHRPRTQVTVLLEVEGAAHYLPAYAGNLDIMTSAALRVGEEMALRGRREVAA
ncbi:acetaldehyde dehydrogenase (acetylating) [Streptomyces sp. NPDC005438]|uniref:acetaldehyde dehydrogenase (acetylating) n=1 Tax=Streptomyces sp. NPDC005438 TaxID=3156880 RepID=UPI0033B40A34